MFASNFRTSFCRGHKCRPHLRTNQRRTILVQTETRRPSGSTPSVQTKICFRSTFMTKKLSDCLTAILGNLKQTFEASLKTDKEKWFIFTSCLVLNGASKLSSLSSEATRSNISTFTGWTDMKFTNNTLKGNGFGFYKKEIHNFWNRQAKQCSCF